MRPYSVETNAESPEHIQQGRPSVWKDGPVCYEDEEAELLGLHGSLVSRVTLIDLALVVD